ncbi:MAG: hypothetical protein RIE53_06615 [Rhodothermales bacterium]
MSLLPSLSIMPTLLAIVLAVHIGGWLTALHPASPPVARVTLNEYLAIPDTDGVEFIELLVGGSAPLVGNRLAIRDGTAAWRVFPDEAGYMIPGQYVVVTPDTLAFVRRHGPLPAQALLIQLRPWPTLNNGGDSLFVAVDGHVVDRAGWTAADVVRGTSRERISPVLPGTLASSWATSTAPPGTPGLRNATYVDDRTAPRILGVEWVPPDRILVHVDEPIAPSAPEPPALTPVPDIPAVDPLPLSCAVPDETVCSTLVALAPSGWWPGQQPAPNRAPDQVDITGLVDLSGNRAGTVRAPMHIPPSPGDLMISEVQSRGAVEFVELVVDAEWPLTLRQTALSTVRSDTRLASEEAPLLLPPGAVHVVDVDLLATGETLVLRDATIVIDSVVIHPDLEDGRFRSHTDRSLRRVGGAARDWASSLVPPATPGTDADRDLRRRAAPPTPSTDPPPLVLTEVMYHPLIDAHDNRTDQTAFLEWVNQSREPVDILGMVLLDAPDERGDRDSVRLGYQPLRLPPDSTLLIVGIPGHVTDQEIVNHGNVRDYLARIWPETPATDFLVPVRASLGLRNDGRALILVDRDGRVLSSDRYGPEDHHPMVAVTLGRSLERRRLQSGWSQLETSTHVDGATPGRVAGLPPTGAAPAVPDGGISAHLEPRSFYPDHPDLGASTHIVVRIPEDMGPRMATITVYNAYGHPVRHVTAARPLSGTTAIRWDGLDDRGTIVPAGIHFVLVSLLDAPTWRQPLPVAVLRR